MSELATQEARAAVTAAIGEIEKKTSAELVVVKRPASGDYRAADLRFGALAALALLAVFLYAPEPFDFTYLPAEEVVTFVLGSIFAAHVPPIRRFLSSAKGRASNVAIAARSEFVTHGVSRTHSRRGLLVYLSMFERSAALVLDVGLDEKKLGAHLGAAKLALREAYASGKTAAFVTALNRLGDVLAESYPHHDGDVSELSDEVDDGEVAA